MLTIKDAPSDAPSDARQFKLGRLDRSHCAALVWAGISLCSDHPSSVPVWIQESKFQSIYLDVISEMFTLAPSCFFNNVLASIMCIKPKICRCELMSKIPRFSTDSEAAAAI